MGSEPHFSPLVDLFYQAIHNACTSSFEPCVRDRGGTSITLEKALVEKFMSGPTDTGQKVIHSPALHVVLYQPQIPANTGNIARLCAAAELRLHLIHPLGFRVDDKHLKRAGLDYWPQVDVRHHLTFRSFLDGIEEGARPGIIGFSSHGAEEYTKARVSRGDYLLFGPETLGLPVEIRRRLPCYRIPIWGKVRSLNLSTCVGIVTYHYLHRMRLF